MRGARSRRVCLRGAVGILVLALSGGCGDAALSKDDYVARLNAACEDFTAREKRIGEPQNVSDLVEDGPTDTTNSRRQESSC